MKEHIIRTIRVMFEILKAVVATTIAFVIFTCLFVGYWYVKTNFLM